MNMNERTSETKVQENDDLKKLSAKDLIYELLYWRDENYKYFNGDETIPFDSEKEAESLARYYDVKDEIIARCEGKAE